ncbi:RHS repeat-associated core domain-containing protein [Reinekea blandensis]|uniref:YD repeat n=1 Tax=Reinekea blandensis MED297 TaxID=314283 RepID=A4B8X0_9GAMM|nr:RHS repeat-associated core domain-containing protein [Reinekea blandensis]EAR11071.1 YD repeat [Reinekea sp. MED297] [Reinekea blandensis MED297]
MIIKLKTTTVKSLALAVAVSMSATAGWARTTSYTYNELDQVTSVDGPRTDVEDVTTYDYDLATANLLSVTNATGHTTTYSNYTGGGLAQTITTPNGAVIDVQYDWKGNVLQQTVTTQSGSQTTVYGYNKSGSLTSVEQPNGAVIFYEYDGAQRLVAMSNSDGERIDYTLDSAGNITAQTVKDASSSIVRQHTQVFDDLNRLREHVGGTDQQTTKLDYDADSRNTAVTDPKNNPPTQNSYDALSRLTEVVDPEGGTTTMTYNDHGLIETVTDPRGLTTRYDYNGYGELERITSPDTGVTTFTHDEAGNVTSRTNANGTTIEYSYDALNRLTEQRYPADPTKNVLFTYDNVSNGITGTPNYGKGQLTGITHYGGQTEYQYDQLGRLVAEQRSFDSQTYTTLYFFNSVGQLEQMQYPSGRLVNYTYDNQGRLAGISTQASAGATVQPVVTDLHYLPFGPTSGFTYGNGLTQNFQYDLDYRLTDIVSNVQNWVYQYDLNSNIERITHVDDVSKDQQYQYDALNRLTAADGPYGSYAYQYDEVGNRTQRQKATPTETFVEDYDYATDANQLTNIDITTDGVETDNRQFVYSESGQLILDMNNDRTLDLAYDENDRLAEVEIHEGPQLAQYTYNPLGQRITKMFEGERLHIHYDAQGKRIAETDANGNILREYLYLGQQPIAMFFGSELATVAEPGTVTPSRIEAEDFINSYDTSAGDNGDSVCDTGDTDSQATGDADGVCNIGWTAAGEWTEYTIEVSAAGTYQINVRSAANSGTQTISLELDGLPFDSAKAVPAQGWQTYSDIEFLDDIPAGEHTLRLRFDTGEVNVNYLSFESVSEGIDTQQVNVEVAFIHSDHLGTPKLLTDSLGNVVWQQHTTPFGEVHETLGNGLGYLQSFPGQWRDSESGLSYNYYRDYDPSLGRYIQSDPIGLGGGLNTYAYVGGNPISRIDPLGLDYEDMVAALPALGGMALADTPAPGPADAVAGVSLAILLMIPGDSTGYEGSSDVPETPGHCTAGLHASLQADVQKYCKDEPRSCKNTSLSCQEYSARMAANQMCAAARQRVNNICYNGGDAGHREAAAEAWKAAGLCAQRMRENQCEGCLP